MRFLCDMGLSLKVADWLRLQGHDVLHLRDQGLQRLPNGEIFAKAIAERRVILTFDLEFGDIAAMARGEFASVVLFRLRNTRADHVIRRLASALGSGSEALHEGAIVIVEETRLRVRDLPIGRRHDTG